MSTDEVEESRGESSVVEANEVLVHEAQALTPENPIDTELFEVGVVHRIADWALN